MAFDQSLYACKAGCIQSEYQEQEAKNTKRYSPVVGLATESGSAKRNNRFYIIVL